MFSIKNIGTVLLVLFSISLANAQIKIGEGLPNLTLQDTKNSAIKLNSFKGKTVLVDFWASWCGPCRLANRKLVKMYDKYKGKNFEIVGISIDTDKSKWIKAIEKDKIQYVQLIDPKGFDAKTAISFGVDALPATFLFDATGKLIAINPSESQIISQINKK